MGTTTKKEHSYSSCAEADEIVDSEALLQEAGSVEHS